VRGQVSQTKQQAKLQFIHLKRKTEAYFWIQPANHRWTINNYITKTIQYFVNFSTRFEVPPLVKYILECVYSISNFPQSVHVHCEGSMQVQGCLRLEKQNSRLFKAAVRTVWVIKRRMVDCGVLLLALALTGNRLEEPKRTGRPSVMKRDSIL
jgi:hypothetical protein